VPLSLVKVPWAGPRARGAGRNDLGLCIAARNALNAEAFSAAAGRPWAGSPAFTPPTRTLPPDLMLLGTSLVMAWGPGGLVWDEAACAPARFPPEISAADSTATDRVIIRRIPVTPGDGRPPGAAPWQPPLPANLQER